MTCLNTEYVSGALRQLLSATRSRVNDLRQRGPSRTMACALLLGVAAVSSQLHAERVGNTASIDMMRAPMSLRPVVEAPQAPVRDALVVGDRLKIVFNESMEFPGEGGKPAEAGGAALQTFYQRMDLTGEYSVREDGTISLPILGSFTAAGRSLVSFEEELKGAFRRGGSARGQVSIAIAERPPVYVVGAVKTSGAVKYVPRMTVLHAVAMSGGLDLNGAVGLSNIDAMREREKAARSSDRLRRLLAKQAWLKSETEKTALATPQRLIDIAGAATAKSVMDAEGLARKLVGEARQAQRQALANAVEHATSELAALRKRVSAVEDVLKAKEVRLRELDKQRVRGNVTAFALAATTTDVSETQGRRQDAAVAVIQAENRLAQAEAARAKLAADLKVAVAEELGAVNAEIAEVEGAIATSEAMLGLSGAFGIGAKFEIKYEIVRSGATGADTIAVDETAEIKPGDIVRLRQSKV